MIAVFRTVCDFRTAAFVSFLFLFLQNSPKLNVKEQRHIFKTVELNLIVAEELE